MSLRLTPHFGMNELILTDLKESARLQTFPRYRSGDALYLDRSGTPRRFTADLPVCEPTATATKSW